MIGGLKMKKQILATVFAAALALPFAANAAEPIVTDKQLGGGSFSGSVNFVNQYLFRGIPQSGGIPALQGDIGYTQPIGPVNLSVGAWGSNVDFSDGDEASVEIDYTFGLSGEVKGFSWGVGGIYYSYPGAASSLDYDFWEVYGTLGYDFKVLSAELGINYSPENFGNSGDAVYYSGTFNVPLGKYVDLGLHLGYQTIDDNAAFGVPDYFHYQISVGTNIAGVDLSLAWNDTDLNDSECGKCGQFLVTVGKSF
jgi:uncharacterized protein (TIGR02001 family)